MHWLVSTENKSVRLDWPHTNHPLPAHPDENSPTMTNNSSPLLGRAHEPPRPASPRWPILFRAGAPVLFFALLIALESTAAFGSNHTSAPLHTLCRSLLGAAVDSNWAYLHHLLRKTGHFLGYGVFSVLLFRGFRQTLGNKAAGLGHRLCSPHLCDVRSCDRWTSHLLAVAATLCVASADEIHQFFVPNRTGRLADVVLDTAGAIAFQLLLAAVLHGARAMHRFRTQSACSAAAPQSLAF